jgi:hypothetical protein
MSKFLMQMSPALFVTPNQLNQLINPEPKPYLHQELSEASVLTI